MTKATVELRRRLVFKVEGGYQIKEWQDDGAEPVGIGKVYFHPTSAYAALGRLQHKEALASTDWSTDPAKAAPKQ